MSKPIEAELIGKVADQYRQRGYTVDVEPKGERLPEFLRGFQPDLIARRPGESVVVEVKVGTRTSVAERLRAIAERVNREPGWKFSLVFANPDQPDVFTEAEPAPLPLILERVANAEILIGSGQQEAAFVVLWSAVEGILRFLGERADLPLSSLPPSTLMRELYSAGEISREQLETLLRLLPVRNQLVHGVGSKPQVDLAALKQVVDALLQDAQSGGVTT